MYCIYLLHKIGTYRASNFGLSPLDWMDIESFSRSTELNLSGFEVETIRQLSQVFVTAYISGSEPLKAPEFAEKETSADAAKRLRSQMSVFKNRG